MKFSVCLAKSEKGEVGQGGFGDQVSVAICDT
jgi:hypothetical protein